MDNSRVLIIFLLYHDDSHLNIIKSSIKFYDRLLLVDSLDYFYYKVHSHHLFMEHPTQLNYQLSKVLFPYREECEWTGALGEWRVQWLEP